MTLLSSMVPNARAAAFRHARPAPLRSISSSSSSSNSLHTTPSSRSLNKQTPYNLCFLRHGQSTWNRDNRFIGWTDTPLTDDGVLEARIAGQMLQKSGLQVDVVYTSWLRRAIRTANLALMEMGQEYVPVQKHWRLNERSYGNLVGRDKKEAVREYGAEKVKAWRRSYDTPPPAMADNHEFHPARDLRYQNMLDKIPHAESLKDTVGRSSVYWDTTIAPALRKGQTVMIVGHENNLRSLIMRLEGLDPASIINLNLPRAVPLAYQLNVETLEILTKGYDSATGMLRGEWLGGDDAVAQILHRDHEQVYNTAVTENLELRENSRWTEQMVSDTKAVA